jgi:uncharacterized protein (UPF0261 family)
MDHPQEQTTSSTLRSARISPCFGTMPTPGTIALIGAFDTKAQDYSYLQECIHSRGHKTLTIDTSVLATTDHFTIDVSAQQLATAADTTLAELRASGDRGLAMTAMAAGAALVASRLYADGKFDAIIGMGGTGGTSVISAAMRALPLGVPKLCVSTAASGDTSAFVGLRDIVMMPSIVDVAGVNRISRGVYARAAGAICGMVETDLGSDGDRGDTRPVIAASMFGNTTECVEACATVLDKAGYEVLVFHATGTGGRTMEALVDEGLVDAVLDITTTEWADTICGGIFDAGKERLSAPGRQGLPHLIVPGCIDMANFGAPESVPERYRDGSRTLYEWNPAVTLLRTNIEENQDMARAFAAHANVATGPIAFLLPLRGLSILDGDGERFCDREADQAFAETLREHLKPEIPIHEVDANINDTSFSTRAVELMLELIDSRKTIP